MLPAWMREKENYQPLDRSDNHFLKKTIGKIAYALSNIKQERPERIALGFSLPVAGRLLLLIGAIVVLSASQSRFALLLFFALVQGLLTLCSAHFILRILKLAFMMSLATFVLLIPNMLMKPAEIANNLLVVAKVFMTLEMVHIFSGTTEWHQLTKALRKLHVPGVFIFTLDITLKYIVLLGNLLLELLSALELRSVGKNDKRYHSLGGILGTTFVRSTEISQEMYEAMRCRCFTDDYKEL